VSILPRVTAVARSVELNKNGEHLQVFKTLRAKNATTVVSVGIARGLGVQPPVHVYRRSFLNENRF